MFLGKFANIEKRASSYRDRVEVHAIRNVGGVPHVLASVDGSGIAFPGGGIERGGAVSSAKREMLEEAGYRIKKPRLASKGRRYTMSQKWQDESLSKRGKQYRGVNNHIVTADLDSKDERLLGVEGDEMSGLRLIPVEQADFMLRKQEQMAEFDDKDGWSRRATASRAALRPYLTKRASVSRDLLLEADRDPRISGFVRPESGAARVPFRHEGEVVGFMTPRKDPDGYHRVGAVYVKPEYRGKGIASRHIEEYMRGKKSKVWVDDDNVATARAHTKAGYKKGRRAAKDAHWYVKEASAPRDYKREYRLFHSSPEAKRNRAKRNLWNRRLKGKVPAGYEIDHKRQLRDGGGNGRDNIRFMPVSKNRAEHNRSRVVRDHMRKESAFKQKRYQVDRDKVRREARKTNKRVAGGIGLLLGGLAGSKLGPVGIAGGALGGGLIGRKAGSKLGISDREVERQALMFEREMNQDPLSDLEMAARVAGFGGAPVADREALRRKFAKTASFDPYQWVYDSLVKQAQAVATKRDPAKWEAAKREAKAKMGGKHSARAMQLATQIYKKKGGTYAGKKPSSSSNKLRKWTKQKWKWSGGDTPGEGGKGVYLPKRSAEQLSSTKSGRAKLRQASRVKREATSRGQQFSSHGLHVGKKRSEVS